MLEVNKETFEAEVLQIPGPVLVDFWSTKCEPCMALVPEVEALSEKYGKQIKFCKLNVLENRRLAIGQRVLGLPTICMYRNGEKIAELTKDDATVANIEAMIKEQI
ncbi:MAG: thioredoxin domain-containing protein [Clostridia bacterium]|nr:thioredoxin domain-containing protein [Clostridia bacterium]